ncbi:hypothetical protein LptCag_2496 [Leptospirillum ferriphilum]|uniref:Uncharacterized protein n=1 Tax=Leptospirillum ferriphilum TaxID=178606 RepID=A0A094WHD2_9BACT|nr:MULTISPECIES: hypothetical protein [Leptospirillum]KGA95062.1 hypothetical protein LptCag_2496 [Leptospirillum ferriphilum]
MRKKKAKKEKRGEEKSDPNISRLALVQLLCGPHFTSLSFVRTRTRSIVH